MPVTDDEAVNAFEYLAKMEGIIPAIESAHAVAHAMKIAPAMDPNKIIVITISGRGDKDCAAIARYRGRIFMSNIKKVFEKGKAFIAFITCGDPDLETTARAVRAAAENGADLIELGIPFSDPTAEGSVIQGANLRALNGGITTDKIFAFVKELRKDVTVPMVFMTYANVVFSYGAKKFISACREIEIDGLILPDLPFEEKEEFHPICSQYGVDLISLIAPTSKNRIAMIAKRSGRFYLYRFQSRSDRCEK
mgnify:FL=1